MIMLSIPQVAQRLGLSRQRVHLLVRQKRIRARQAGKSWLIRPQDAEIFAQVERKGGRPKKSIAKD